MIESSGTTLRTVRSDRRSFVILQFLILHSIHAKFDTLSPYKDLGSSNLVYTPRNQMITSHC